VDDLVVASTSIKLIGEFKGHL
jgi:hypothetical protein